MGFWTGRAVIDSDIHNTVPAVQALFPYLSDFWREYISQSGFKGPEESWYPQSASITARPDTKPADGAPAGSDLGLMRTQVLDAWGVEYGILTCAYAVESVHNPDAAAALASAVNDWQIAEWLEQESRLRASLVVPSQHPEMAAREIERLGNHPGFVQVLLPARSAAPYGNRRFHPIFDAAVRHDLVVGIHFGGAPGNPPTAVGWPSYYIEEYVGMATVFQSQLMSLICEGVFDQFPTLHVALIESGFTWLPSFAWRLDKEWKGLRREVPWVRRLPSEYIHEHVRITTQPLDAPNTDRQMRQIVGQLESDDLLMFSTDYPHWHFDTPEEASPPVVWPTEVMDKVLYGNAHAFYRL
ncbi:MAG: amidohydrolase family protein [Thermomicrobiales bacterium]